MTARSLATADIACPKRISASKRHLPPCRRDKGPTKPPSPPIFNPCPILIPGCYLPSPRPKARGTACSSRIPSLPIELKMVSSFLSPFMKCAGLGCQGFILERERSMSKHNRGRGRYRYRYRMAAGWDSDIRNRVPQPYCCSADTTRQ